MNILLADCGIPISWYVVKGTEPGSWKPHWQKLIEKLQNAIPCSFNVIVTADRGLYAPQNLGIYGTRSVETYAGNTWQDLCVHRSLGKGRQGGLIQIKKKLFVQLIGEGTLCLRNSS